MMESPGKMWSVGNLVKVREWWISERSPPPLRGRRSGRGGGSIICWSRCMESRWRACSPADRKLECSCCSWTPGKVTILFHFNRCIQCFVNFLPLFYLATKKKNISFSPVGVIRKTAPVSDKKKVQGLNHTPSWFFLLSRLAIQLRIFPKNTKFLFRPCTVCVSFRPCNTYLSNYVRQQLKQISFCRVTWCSRNNPSAHTTHDAMPRLNGSHTESRASHWFSAAL